MAYLPIKLGIPTLIDYNTVEKHFVICKRYKFNFIELDMTFPQYQLERLNVSEIKHLIKETGIFLTFHLEKGLDPFNFNSAVADSYLNTVIQTIELAKELKVPVLNMHMNDGVFVVAGRKTYLYQRHLDEYMERVRIFREAVERTVGLADIAICIENTNGFQRFHRTAIDYLMESDYFGLTFNAGHNAIAGYKDEKYYAQHFSQLRHMNIHDASLEECHLPLGEGRIRLSKHLRTAEQKKCTCVIGIKSIPDLNKCVQYLKEKEAERRWLGPIKI